MADPSRLRDRPGRFLVRRSKGPLRSRLFLRRSLCSRNTDRFAGRGGGGGGFWGFATTPFFSWWRGGSRISLSGEMRSGPDPDFGKKRTAMRLLLDPLGEERLGKGKKMYQVPGRPWDRERAAIREMAIEIQGTSLPIMDKAFVVNWRRRFFSARLRPRGLCRRPAGSGRGAGAGSSQASAGRSPSTAQAAPGGWEQPDRRRRAASLRRKNRESNGFGFRAGHGRRMAAATLVKFLKFIFFYLRGNRWNWML